MVSSNVSTGFISGSNFTTLNSEQPLTCVFFDIFFFPGAKNVKKESAWDFYLLKNSRMVKLKMGTRYHSPLEIFLMDIPSSDKLNI